MASIVQDRVKDTTTTTGTGDITLANSAPTGFVTFATAFPVGDPFYYAIVGQSGGEWEVGRTTLSGSTTLVRNGSQIVYASSTGTSAVSFSVGTKDVFCTIPAFQINRTFSQGQSVALTIGATLS